MDAASDLTDRYELGEPLGIGGTATVFRATHRESGRQVAVKIYDAHRPASIPRQRSEAATLAELNHPGLVEIDEVGVHDGRTYLVMRLVDGEALAQLIDRGPLPLADVVAIGARLADTLRHVHDRGVVHRDVKPSNVLLDADRSPHLTDFGVSKLVDATRITATGSVVGTPAYMAPEQVRGQEVEPAADVYALGLVLLEALTGLREYPGSVVESAVARLHRDPVVPRELPAGLRALLTAMTAQDPANRPSASTVVQQLTALESNHPVPAVARRSPVRVAVAAAALVIAALVGIVGLLPAAPEPVAAPRAVPVAPGPTPVETAGSTPVASTATTPMVAQIADVEPDRSAPAARTVPIADEPPGRADEPVDSVIEKAATGKGGQKAKKEKKDKSDDASQ